jgi:pentatricopeptide repeat protein
MIEKGCAPNASTFNTLIVCVAKFGNVNAVHRIYDIMKEFKYEPNAVTYNTLMKMLEL